MPKNLILQVIVPVPFGDTFDYIADTTSQLLVGMRVQIPFGNRTLVGIISNLNKNSSVSAKKLKSIIKVIDKKPFLSELELEMIFWLASYYCHPCGLVLKSYLPKLLRSNSAGNLNIDNKISILSAVTNVDTKPLNRSPKKISLYNKLLQADLPLSEAKKNYSSNIIKGLLDAQYIRIKSIEQNFTNLNPSCAPAPYELNQEQVSVIKEVTQSLATFKVFALMGVTGSGKTEIYIQLIAKLLSIGKQALLLIPEISLTPQTLNRLKSRFNAQIVTLHSNLSDKNKTKAWLECRKPGPRIIIGTRMAAFASMPNPGIIIVDEEHDSSFCQQNGMYYNARDFLVKRAMHSKCPIILASATLSLETFNNCLQKKYHLINIKKRANQQNLPRFNTVDIRHNKLSNGLAYATIEAIKKELEFKRQVLIFLNRRGFSPILTCADCKWVDDCRNCASHKTFHLSKNKLICHHCNLVSPVPNRCPKCENINLFPLGLGTERIFLGLQQHFPKANILKIDKDTTGTTKDWEKIYEKTNSENVNILVGTQMLAKGHHFPNISLAVIVDADAAFYSGDFRSLEKLSQISLQVAGRAGRGTAYQGKVLMQTMHPQHEIIKYISEYNHTKISEYLLEERRKLNLPPFVHQAGLFVYSKKLKTNISFLEKLSQHLESIYKKQLKGESLHIDSPLSEPIYKKNTFYNNHMLIRANERLLRNKVIKSIHEYIANLKLNNHSELKGISFNIKVDC